MSYLMNNGLVSLSVSVFIDREINSSCEFTVQSDSRFNRDSFPFVLDFADVF